MLIIDNMYIKFCVKLAQLIEKGNVLEICEFAHTVRKWEDLHGLNTLFDNQWYKVYHGVYRTWLQRAK